MNQAEGVTAESLPAATPELRRSKTEQAFDLLEDLIVFQELAPGTMLSESRLMELTGLGRTPVREALQQLAREHLVEIHPHRGTLVAPISTEAQLKALEVRRSVEELAVSLASQRATDHQKADMARLVDDLLSFDSDDMRGFAILLARSHHLIASAVHNEFLTSVISSLHGPSRRFWFAHMKDRRFELRQAATLHADMLIAICAAKEEDARTASHALHAYLTEFTYRTIGIPTQ